MYTDNRCLHELEVMFWTAIGLIAVFVPLGSWKLLELVGIL